MEYGNLEISNNYKNEQGIKLGGWMANQRTHYKQGTLSEQQIQQLNSIGMIWKYYAANRHNPKSWEEWYEYVLAYYKKNGHIRIPKRYVTEDKIRLGTWILTQRQLLKKDKLSKERIDKLNQLGMEWETESFNQTSYPEQVFLYYIGQNFEGIENRANRDIGMEADILLSEYKIIIEYDGRWHVNREERDLIKNRFYLDQGYTVIRIRDSSNASLIGKTQSAKYVELDDRKVFETIDVDGMNQLVSEVLNILSRLTGVTIISQVDVLRDNDVIYAYTNNNQNWEDWYQLAVEYYEINGDLLVPYNYVTDSNKKLGQWVLEQRKTYKKSSVKGLTKEQISKLKMIGMEWSLMTINEENPSTWENWYELACNYEHCYHNLRIVRTYCTEDGFKLGDWIHNQRKKRAENTLSVECIQKLEEIHMIWNETEDRWKNNYEAAKEYYEENNTLKIPITYKTKDGLNLGKWISHQREKFHSNKLSKDYITQLEQIGMVWIAGKKQSEYNCKNTPN